MSAEIVSTARPSGLRLAGFLAVAIGAVLLGLGVTRDWAAVGLVQDTRHANDVSIVGTDLWEGKAVLFAAVAALVLVLVMRIASSGMTRRAIAVATIVLGVVGTALAVWVATTAENRFAETEGVDRIAAEIARQTGDSEDVVREALLETLRGDLRVEVASGVWLTAAGGVVLAVGGVLGLAWLRERDRAASPSPADHLRETRETLR